VNPTTNSETSVTPKKTKSKSKTKSKAKSTDTKKRKAKSTKSTSEKGPVKKKSKKTKTESIQVNETAKNPQENPVEPITKLPFKISFKPFPPQPTDSGPSPMQHDPENDVNDAGEDSQMGTETAVPDEPTHLDVKDELNVKSDLMNVKEVLGVKEDSMNVKEEDLSVKTYLMTVKEDIVNDTSPQSENVFSQKANSLV